MPLTWRFVQKEQSLNPPALDPIGYLISAADKKTPASEGSGLFSRQLPCEATLQLSCPFAGKDAGSNKDCSGSVSRHLGRVDRSCHRAWQAMECHGTRSRLVRSMAPNSDFGSVPFLTRARLQSIDIPRRDLVRGGHYGQRPRVPHLKAEHMAAPTKTAKREESSPTPSRPHMAQSGHPGCSREIKKAENRPFRAGPYLRDPVAPPISRWPPWEKG